MDAFDIVLKALLVLATLVVWLSPVTWLSMALSDVNMKVAIVTVVICIAVFDPVLALIVMAFFITVLIHAPVPKAGAAPSKDMAAAAKAAAYVVAPSSSADEPRQRVVAPEEEGGGIVGRVLGSHPEKPPLGWSETAIAPPTGDEILATNAACESNEDIDLQILCGVPDERLRDIQNAAVPGSQGCDDADEDTGMALVGGNTMLLR